MKPHRITQRLGAAMAASLWLALASTSQAQAPACGTLENHYGPFDYRTQRDKLQIVEKYHFTPSVEALTRGASTTKLAGDISYLMNTSPNHHRGLWAIMRLVGKGKVPTPAESALFGRVLL